ncbi:FliG C-terminal domain-containing protein [Bacteriovorax sp. Seq25_V]|uniref:FliG C-terminal domain-containing protein n=1 Tax=Bacteriovorax sp. Seq25_V TaxID=1201288 RepID=UPI000389DA9B|nr:FliG C-terminal domain-containing protein [Bacteriovorax sp. Seq25_V]EQC47202.1 FliG C-terminal domain protein [Bacteriovorax sp. Seq25_V]
MNLWSCYSPDYIEAEFNRMKEQLETVEMWQTLDDYREKFSGYFTEVSSQNCKIQLDEKYKNAYGRIHVQNPIFFHYPKRDMLFKKDIFTIETGNIISFKTPTEVKFRDLRVSKRFYYKYQDFKNISFHTDDSEIIHNHILTDISTTGLSFVVNQKDRNKISKNNKILIVSLTDQNLEEVLEARVIYLTPFKLSREANSELIQIGVEFTSPMDSISYRSISKIVKSKQEKIKGLDTTKFNGLNPDEFKRAISTIAQSNKQLALNIRERSEDIDRLRYLTIEMKRAFLLEVNHDLLACAMRMSSKELIFDLFSEVTDSIRDEFLEKLDEQKPASAINKAQDAICKFISEKERSGEIILDPRSYLKMV